VADTFIADLKDAVRDAKCNPSGKGTMCAVYGEFGELGGQSFSRTDIYALRSGQLERSGSGAGGATCYCVLGYPVQSMKMVFAYCLMMRHRIQELELIFFKSKFITR